MQRTKVGRLIDPRALPVAKKTEEPKSKITVYSFGNTIRCMENARKQETNSK